MTDKLSIAASAAAVVVTGMSVTKGLYNIANTCDTAGSEVRGYATDTASFSTALSLIRDKMLRPTDITIEEMALVMDLTDICNQILTPLSHIQQSLESLLVQHQDSPKKVRQIISQISWYFSKKSNLLFYREAMRGHQQNLDALLAAMTYESAKDLMHQMALQNALIAGRGATDRFQGDTIRLYSQLDAPAPLIFMGSGTSEAGLNIDDVFRPSVTSSTEPSRQGVPSGNNASWPLSGEDSDSIGQGLQAMEAMIEESLDSSGTSALDLYEDLRVATRKTTRFAEKISKNTDEGDAPSYSEATGSSPPPLHVPVPVPIFHTQSQPQPSAPTTTATSSASASALAIGSDSRIIVLQDSLGKYHNLPYEKARTTNGMQTLLKELYSDSSPAVQGWRKDLTKLAQNAIHVGTYVLKDSVTRRDIPPYELRTMLPDKRLRLKFKDNRYLNMNNEELLQLEADSRKPSGWKGMFK